MGCEQSLPVPRMDTENMLALQDNFNPLQTRIIQEEVIDHLNTVPPTPISSRDISITLSRPPSSKGCLFEDETFPLDGSTSNNKVQWIRPHQLCQKPKLFIDGVSRGDVKQGILGDCWLLSACAAVATKKNILESVIPSEQCLYGSNYQGQLDFHFWRFGELVHLCIDDRLPTVGGKLLFASCTHSEEFWLPLLEKAFAKLYGGYSCLEGGHAAAALTDLTGGIAERIFLKQSSFEEIEMIFKHGAFVTCAGNSTVSSGIVGGHAYTLTGVDIIRTVGGSTVNLVRLRSPWADHVEWNGPWSDRSSHWNNVSSEEKSRLKVLHRDDGEFWMEFRDFQKQFQELTVCTLGPDFDRDGASDSPRQSALLRGSWSFGGGSRNNVESFQENPQYLLSIPEDVSKTTSNILVGLMQLRGAVNTLLPIAFFIYRTESGKERLTAEYFLCVLEETSSGPFTDSQEVFVRASLQPGLYVIIPATFHPNTSAQFVLRVFALHPFTLRELT